MLGWFGEHVSKTVHATASKRHVLGLRGKRIIRCMHADAGAVAVVEEMRTRKTTRLFVGFLDFQQMEEWLGLGYSTWVKAPTR